MPEAEVQEGKNFKPVLQGHKGLVEDPSSSAVLPRGVRHGRAPQIMPELTAQSIQ